MGSNIIYGKPGRGGLQLHSKCNVDAQRKGMECTGDSGDVRLKLTCNPQDSCDVLPIDNERTAVAPFSIEGRANITYLLLDLTEKMSLQPALRPNSDDFIAEVEYTIPYRNIYSERKRFTADKERTAAKKYSDWYIAHRDNVDSVKFISIGHSRAPLTAELQISDLAGAEKLLNSPQSFIVTKGSKQLGTFYTVPELQKFLSGQRDPSSDDLTIIHFKNTPEKREMPTAVTAKTWGILQDFARWLETSQQPLIPDTYQDTEIIEGSSTKWRLDLKPNFHFGQAWLLRELYHRGIVNNHVDPEFRQNASAALGLPAPQDPSIAGAINRLGVEIGATIYPSGQDFLGFGITASLATSGQLSLFDAGLRVEFDPVSLAVKNPDVGVLAYGSLGTTKIWGKSKDAQLDSHDQNISSSWGSQHRLGVEFYANVADIDYTHSFRLGLAADYTHAYPTLSPDVYGVNAGEFSYWRVLLGLSIVGRRMPVKKTTYYKVRYVNLGATGYKANDKDKFDGTTWPARLEKVETQPAPTPETAPETKPAPKAVKAELPPDVTSLDTTIPLPIYKNFVFVIPERPQVVARGDTTFRTNSEFLKTENINGKPTNRSIAELISKLKNTIAFANKYGFTNYAISGKVEAHADPLGGVSYNDSLSERRAGGIEALEKRKAGIEEDLKVVTDQKKIIMSKPKNEQRKLWKMLRGLNQKEGAARRQINKLNDRIGGLTKKAGATGIKPGYKANLTSELASLKVSDKAIDVRTEAYGERKLIAYKCGDDRDTCRAFLKTMRVNKAGELNAKEEFLMVPEGADINLGGTSRSTKDYKIKFYRFYVPKKDSSFKQSFSYGAAKDGGLALVTVNGTFYLIDLQRSRRVEANLNMKIQDLDVPASKIKPASEVATDFSINDGKETIAKLHYLPLREELGGEKVIKKSDLAALASVFTAHKGKKVAVKKDLTIFVNLRPGYDDKKREHIAAWIGLAAQQYDDAADVKVVIREGKEYKENSVVIAEGSAAAELLKAKTATQKGTQGYRIAGQVEAMARGIYITPYERSETSKLKIKNLNVPGTVSVDLHYLPFTGSIGGKEVLERSDAVNLASAVGSYDAVPGLTEILVFIVKKPGMIDKNVIDRYVSFIAQSHTRYNVRVFFVQDKRIKKDAIIIGEGRSTERLFKVKEDDAARNIRKQIFNLIKQAGK